MLSALLLLASCGKDDGSKNGSSTTGNDPAKGTTCTVTFDTDGGSPLVQSQKIETGGTVSIPVNPEKQDYLFRFWHLSDATTAYDFNMPITANITLVAEWIPAVVKAKYTTPNVAVTYKYSGSVFAGMNANYVIDWPEVPGAIEYKVYLNISGDTYLRTTTAELSISSYELFIDAKTYIYYYWVIAVVDNIETLRPANGGIKVTYTVSRSTQIYIPGGPPYYIGSYQTIGSDNVSRQIEQNPIN